MSGWYYFLCVHTMKYILIILFAGVITMACIDSDQVSEKTVTTDTSSSPKTTDTIPGEKMPEDKGIGCFIKVSGRDTAILILEQKGNELSGKMLYDNFEKDGSHGIIKGNQDGDILKLFYDFNSEGMHSVMEVYFKKVEGGLIRGMGNMDVTGDTTYFTSGINYSVKDAFSKVDCELVRGKFQ